MLALSLLTTMGALPIQADEHPPKAPAAGAAGQTVSPAAGDSAAAPGEEVVQGTRTALAALEPLASSEVSGHASLLQSGLTTTLVVTLGGLSPDTAHAGHIHGGGCSGPVLFPLATLQADEDGNGSASATVPAPLDPGAWWVQYHAAESPPGPGITCGPVEASSAAPLAPGVGDRCPTADGVATERC
jgi:hypothetical protein